MKLYDRALVLFAFGTALTCVWCGLFAPLQYSHLGWFVAFPGWWLVGVALMAMSKKK